MKLSKQQDEAMKAIVKWLKDPGAGQVFYLAGYAGTGKTTIAKLVKDHVRKVQFGAYTGKAALVLASKGCRPSGTIHSFVYKLDNSDSPVPQFVVDREGRMNDVDLAVIDEVSMVGRDIALDLLSFGKKVLVLGDPAQLPPVQKARGKDQDPHKESGYFTSRKPDFMLTEVHRQARDNPIIRMSMDIREGRSLEYGTYGNSSVIRARDLDPQQVLDADQVIVGLNKTRRTYNGRIRELLGRSGFFEVGERVITVDKNDKEKGILNGALWDVTKITFQDDEESNLHLRPIDAGASKSHAEVRTHHKWLTGEEHELDWRVRKAYQPVDYGYVISCHKAQGSQWPSVLLFDQSRAYPFRGNEKEWLYTAITRAAEKITIVGA